MKSAASKVASPLGSPSPSPSFAASFGAPVGEVLDELVYVSNSLEHLSVKIIASSGCALIFLLIGYSSRFGVPLLKVLSLSMPSFAIVMCGGGLYNVLKFERLRKRGEGFFEEVSNELQWRGGKAKSKHDDPPERLGVAPAAEKPGIEARVAMRRFIASTDLPLFPGRSGVSFYATFFLVGLIYATWLLVSK